MFPKQRDAAAAYLTEAGGTDKTDLDNGASGFIDGTLKIWNGGSSTLVTTTIDPVIDSLVRSGEWYTVATHVFVTGSDMPDVEDSVLVSGM